MNTQSYFYAAATDVGQLIDDESQLDSLSARVVRLIGESLAHVKHSKKDIGQLASLTDELLLAEMAVLFSTKQAMVDERELRKQGQRIKAKQAFLATLEAHGGLYKASQVARKLDVSRQTVNNQRRAGKLLSIKSGHDHHFVAFQFDDKGKLPHFETVLRKLVVTSPVTCCSFFLNVIEMDDGEMITPLALLQSTPSEAQLQQLERQAALFGQQTTE